MSRSAPPQPLKPNCAGWSAVGDKVAGGSDECQIQDSIGSVSDGLRCSCPRSRNLRLDCCLQLCCPLSRWQKELLRNGCQFACVSYEDPQSVEGNSERAVRKCHPPSDRFWRSQSINPSIQFPLVASLELKVMEQWKSVWSAIKQRPEIVELVSRRRCE
jgi:hypothetical protein